MKNIWRPTGSQRAALNLNLIVGTTTSKENSETIINPEDPEDPEASFSFHRTLIVKVLPRLPADVWAKSSSSPRRPSLPVREHIG